MVRIAAPRWSLYVVAAAMIASLSFSFGSLYSAFGTSHDTTYYACLYAGSMSQVGTTPPVNCGRGSQISWNSEGVEGPTGPSGTSQAYYYTKQGGVLISGPTYTTVRQFELPAGKYIVFGVIHVIIGSSGTEVYCRLVSGSQESAVFYTQAFAPALSDGLSMQSSFELEAPADIEVQCSVNSDEFVAVHDTDFAAIQVDTVTEVEDSQ